MRIKAFWEYASLLLGPFWRWWWAAITGVASLLSFLAVPQGGVTLSKLELSLWVLAGGVVVFLLLSVLTRSWGLFMAYRGDLIVSGIQPCKEYGGTHVFLLQGRFA